MASLVKVGDLLLHPNMSGNNDSLESHDAGARYISDIEMSISSSWTSIVNNDMVQTLLSAFFETDQQFLTSFIDRDMFLKDLQVEPSQPQNGWFCSILLINAICAITVVGCFWQMDG